MSKIERCMSCLIVDVFFFVCVGRIRRVCAARFLGGNSQGSRVHIGRRSRYRTPSLRRLRQFDTIPFVVVLASYLDDSLLSLRCPKKNRIHFRPFLFRFIQGPFLLNLLLMLLMMVMVMMMMTSLSTGRCAPCRGPAHHSIQRAVITLPPVHRDDFFWQPFLFFQSR